MKTDTDCVFCKIVAGQMPCFKLLEDDNTLAIMDTYPANDGHCLILARNTTPPFSTSVTRHLPPSCARSTKSRERSTMRYRRWD